MSGLTRILAKSLRWAGVTLAREIVEKAQREPAAAPPFTVGDPPAPVRDNVAHIHEAVMLPVEFRGLMFTNPQRFADAVQIAREARRRR